MPADLPKEGRERRTNQWPKLRQAREEGKRAFFSWQEPDQLYIDGTQVPEQNRVTTATQFGPTF